MGNRGEGKEEKARNQRFHIPKFLFLLQYPWISLRDWGAGGGTKLLWPFQNKGRGPTIISVSIIWAHGQPRHGLLGPSYPGQFAVKKPCWVLLSVLGPWPWAWDWLLSRRGKGKGLCCSSGLAQNVWTGSEHKGRRSSSCFLFPHQAIFLFKVTTGFALKEVGSTPLMATAAHFFSLSGARS